MLYLHWIGAFCRFMGTMGRADPAPEAYLPTRGAALVRRGPGAPLLALSVVLAGCNSPAGTAQKEQLLRADRDFAALADRQGAATAFAAYMAGDAMQFRASQPPVVGARSIAAAQGQALGSNRLAWTPRGSAVSRDGSMGWTWGEWRVMSPGDVATPLQRGSYVEVWQRQPDGTWKVTADIGNVAAAAASR
jgi:ketosteroid isomerase-like protein